MKKTKKNKGGNPCQCLSYVETRSLAIDRRPPLVFPILPLLLLLPYKPRGQHAAYDVRFLLRTFDPSLPRYFEGI